MNRFGNRSPLWGHCRSCGFDAGSTPTVVLAIIFVGEQEEGDHVLFGGYKSDGSCDRTADQPALIRFRSRWSEHRVRRHFISLAGFSEDIGGMLGRGPEGEVDLAPLIEVNAVISNRGNLIDVSRHQLVTLGEQFLFSSSHKIKWRAQRPNLYDVCLLSVSTCLGFCYPQRRRSARKSEAAAAQRLMLKRARDPPLWKLARSEKSRYVCRTCSVDHVDRNVDVAPCRLRVRALEVRTLHNLLGDFAVYPRQADVEPSLNEVVAIVRAQVHFGIDGGISRQPDLHFGCDQLDRSQETSRPAYGEQLLRVGARAGSSRNGELNV